MPRQGNKVKSIRERRRRKNTLALQEISLSEFLTVSQYSPNVSFLIESTSLSFIHSRPLLLFHHDKKPQSERMYSYRI